MSEHSESKNDYDIPVPRQPAGYGETRVPEGKGDDQGDHETPTPVPTTDSPSPTPSPTSPSPSPAPSSEHPTEPATTTSTAAHTGDDDAGLPVTSGPDAWVGATLVLCALLALVGGAAMTRAAKRIGTRP